MDHPGSAWPASTPSPSAGTWGESEFKAAEELLPDCRNQYFYLARRVIFEAKASQAEQSDQCLEQARPA